MNNYKDITPQDVLTFSRPTDTFLCPLSANSHTIEFLEFTISDYDTKHVIFQVGRDNPPQLDFDPETNAHALDENAYRSIKYDFSEDVLRLPSIQTTLVFSVGEREVPNFRMIERHYFRDELVKSYDFAFGFCIPNSTNTWDAVYSVPPLEEELINEMIANPYQTRSDSFYFINGQMIMHNKASYKYIREDAAQAKKSYQDQYGAKGSKAAKKAASKYDSDDEDGHRPAAAKAEAKGNSKYDDEAVWSKEEDYY